MRYEQRTKTFYIIVGAILVEQWSVSMYIKTNQFETRQTILETKKITSI